MPCGGRLQYLNKKHKKERDKQFFGKIKKINIQRKINVFVLSYLITYYDTYLKITIIQGLLFHNYNRKYGTFVSVKTSGSHCSSEKMTVHCQTLSTPTPPLWYLSITASYAVVSFNIMVIWFHVYFLFFCYHSESGSKCYFQNRRAVLVWVSLAKMVLWDMISSLLLIHGRLAAEMSSSVLH